MKSLVDAVRAFARDEEGITAIEYGLVAAVAAVAVIAAFKALEPELTGAFTKLGKSITDKIPTAGGSGTGTTG